MYYTVNTYTTYDNNALRTNIMIKKVATYLGSVPSFLVNLLRQSSDSPWKKDTTLS